MNVFLVLVLFFSVTVHAEWPFQADKKTAPVTLEEKLEQAKQLNQKNYVHFFDDWDQRKKMVQMLILRAKTTPDLENITKLIGELQATVDLAKPDCMKHGAQSLLKICESDVDGLKALLSASTGKVKETEKEDQKKAECLAQAVSGYNDRMKMTGAERASIYATNHPLAEYDRFQALSASDKRLEVARQKKKEEELASLEKQREKVFFAPIDISSEVEKYEDKMTKIKAAEAQARHEEYDREMLQTAKEANNIARDVERQLEWNSINQSDGLYHTGTIFFENGHTATYQGN